MEKLRKSCKHNLGFDLKDGRTVGEPELPGVWECISCDFWLNFNPDDFQEGIAYAKQELRKLIPDFVRSSS